MPDVALASFNTHYGVMPVRRPPWRPYDVQGVLRSLEADVIVVQETMRPNGEHGDIDEFAAEHGYELFFGLVGRTTLTTRWPRLTVDGEGTSGIAVLTRSPARRLDDIVLGPTPGDPSPCRVAVRVEVDVDGTPLQVIGVHLTSRLPHGPPIQLRRLSRALPPPGVPAVVAGDCNFWGPPVTALLGGWQRAVRGRTWPARAPHSQIDHVLVRRADIEPLDAKVYPDVGSDHRPVRAVLRIPTRERRDRPGYTRSSTPGAGRSSRAGRCRG
jgi:endonuclease/exonuclease/phosphatase family metal-dependent hydrolase